MSLPDLSDPRIAAVIGAYFGCLILAAWIGGDNRRQGWFSPERAGVATVLAMFVIQSVGYSEPLDSVYDQLDWVALTSDMVGLAGFTWIALNASRIWPIIGAGIQLLAVLSHLVRVSREDWAMAEQAYNVLKSVPTSAMVLFILLGAVLRWIKIRRGESVRDWVPWRKYAEYRALQDRLSDF